MIIINIDLKIDLKLIEMDISFEPLIIEICSILSQNKQTIFTLQLFSSVSKIHNNIIKPKLIKIAENSYKTRDTINYIDIYENKFINYLEYLKNTNLIYSSYWHSKYDLKYKFYIPKDLIEQSLKICNIHPLLGRVHLIQIYRFSEPGLILYSDKKIVDKRFKVNQNFTYKLVNNWCSNYLLNFF